MDNTPRTIVIEPDSELVRALEDIEDPETTPIVLVRNGARFRVIRSLRCRSPIRSWNILLAPGQNSGVEDNSSQTWIC